REENEQRALAEPQADERTNLLEIRGDALRLQPVKTIAAGVVMGLPILGAHKAQHPVAEGDEPELVTLLLGSEAQEERSSYKALEHGGGHYFVRARSGARRAFRILLHANLARGEPRRIHHHIHLLRALHLEDFRHGMRALGR